MRWEQLGERTDLQPSANLPKVSQSEAADMLSVSERSVTTAKKVTLTKIANALDSNDRNLILGSRPRLGFTALCITGSVLPGQLNLVVTAVAIRKATVAQMKRRTCGAMTRRGFGCMLKSEPRKKRCRLHGGLSTGPKTVEGKARIAEAQRECWAERRKGKESLKIS